VKGRTSYVKNNLSEDIYFTTNPLELLKENMEPSPNEMGSMVFESAVSLLELVNLSISNCLSDDFCS